MTKPSLSIPPAHSRSGSDFESGAVSPRARSVQLTSSKAVCSPLGEKASFRLGFSGRAVGNFGPARIEAWLASSPSAPLKAVVLFVSRRVGVRTGRVVLGIRGWDSTRRPSWSTNKAAKQLVQLQKSRESTETKPFPFSGGLQIFIFCCCLFRFCFGWWKGGGGGGGVGLFVTGARP